MGFGTVMSNIASSALVSAQELLGDLSPIVSVVFAITVLGLIISQLRRFS